MTLTSATSTQAVLEHHLQCFGAGDLPGILADFAPDAVMFTPSGVLRGPDGMAPLFQGFFAEFAKPGARFDLQQQSVEGWLGKEVVEQDEALLIEVSPLLLSHR